MYKLITFAALLLGLALAPVLGGSVKQERRGPAQVDSLRIDYGLGHRSSDAAEAGVISCEWRCESCEPGLGCSQVCAEVGDCGTTCDVIAHCDVGYAWDEDRCSCVE